MYNSLTIILIVIIHVDVGVERNITYAIELLLAAQGKHDEAGYYLAEVFFSPDVAIVAASPDTNTNTIDGLVEKTATEAAAVIPDQPVPLRSNLPVMMAASQMYSYSGSKGHVLSMHR